MNPPDPSPPLNYITPGAQTHTDISPRTFLVFDWLILAGAFIATFLMLWATRFPLSDFAYGAFGFFTWIAVIVLGIVNFVAQSVRVTRSARRVSARLARTTLRVLPVLLPFATFLLVHFDVPCRVMFRLNRRALTTWANAALASPPKSNPNTPWARARVGGYTLWHIEPVPTGGVQFFITGSGFFRSTSGYAYCPNTPPSNTYTDTYTPIGNGWYIRIYDGG